MFNLLVIIVQLLALIFAFAYLAYKTKKISRNRAIVEKIDFDYLVNIVKERVARIISDTSFDDIFTTNAEYDKNYAARMSLLESISRCSEGRKADKLRVIALIQQIIAPILDTHEKIDSLYKFRVREELPYNVKFETLLHFRKKHNDPKKADSNTLKALIMEYGVHDVKHEIEDKTKPHYAFTEEEIDRMYDDLLIQISKKENGWEFTIEEKHKIIARLIYQMYKGFGLMDTIDEMSIDGWNIGTSGATILEFAEDKMTFRNSAWVQISGRYIHFRFLDFKDMKAIRRIVTIVVRFQSPGALTKQRGYMVNQMADMSRVAATCPPVADSWAVFIRKFSHDLMDIHSLIAKEEYTNTDLAEQWVKFLIRGKRITAVTGRQSSGKTTLMKAAIEFIDPRLNVRTIEMSNEIYMREHFPERNALGLKETAYVTATQIQDFCKKTDSGVTLVGEVATNEVAANAMQGAKVASEFMIFSHHAVTMEDLITAIRDSLVNANGYDMFAAEKLVIDVIQCNIHCDFRTDGKRYIQRITERLILNEVADYPPLPDLNDIAFSSMSHQDKLIKHAVMSSEVAREYYRRRTDRRAFICKDLIRFDTDTLTYHICNYPSQGLVEDLMHSMEKEDREEFKAFLQKWYIEKAGEVA